MTRVQILPAKVWGEWGKWQVLASGHLAYRWP